VRAALVDLATNRARSTWYWFTENANDISVTGSMQAATSQFRVVRTDRIQTGF